METALMVYVLCASALLVYSTLPHGYPDPKAGQLTPRGTVDYVVISGVLLREWAAYCPNLMIFDLHRDSERNSRHEHIPGALAISADDFRHLVKWLPPGSRIVFSGAGFKQHLDAQTEGILFQLGIEAIYFVDGGTGCLLMSALAVGMGAECQVKRIDDDCGSRGG